MADARSLPPSNDDADLVRSLRALAGPAIATSLLQTLVFAVDRAVLGHAPGPCLAAMQVAGPLEWSIVSIFSAFTVGTIARGGFHLGSQAPERTRAVVRLSFACALAAGVIVAFLGAAFRFAVGVGFAVAPAVFSATAARISALKEVASTFSPSAISMARRTLPSRLELNSPAGSCSDAPLANVTFTTDL